MLVMWWIQSSKVHQKVSHHYGVKVDVLQTSINRIDMNKIFVVSTLVRQLACEGQRQSTRIFRLRLRKERKRHD